MNRVLLLWVLLSSAHVFADSNYGHVYKAEGALESDIEKISQGMKAQHGFVLSKTGLFASHLVASGHHSHQTSVSGELIIKDKVERERYNKRRILGEGVSYFVLQAQDLYLSGLIQGQLLRGHIIESKLGDYEPNNKIVSDATFLVKTIHLSLENPFFN